MPPTNNRALAALVDVLGAHRALTVDVVDGDPARVQVQYGTERSVLVPHWAGEGYPADVLRAVRDIKASPGPAGTSPVVVAHRISAGARYRLDSWDMSWADELGNAFIAAPPSLLVFRDGEAPPPVPRPSEFTAASGALAELLLGDTDLPSHATIPPVARLAATLGVSSAVVSRALQHFDGQGWTAKSGPDRGPGSRRALVDRTAMLSAWAAWDGGLERTPVLAHGLLPDPAAWLRDTVVARWPSGAWAVTGLVALHQRAPLSTTLNPVEIYLDADLFRRRDVVDALLDEAGLRRVDTGARVHLLAAGRFTLPLAELQAPRSPVPQVGDIRLYSDLLHAKGAARGAELAEHLRETRIGF